MVSTDADRRPALLAGGQLTGPRPGPDAAPGAAPDPIELMARAVERAAGGAGGRRLLERVTHLWVLPPLSLRSTEPAALLARRLGIEPAEARCGGMGGNAPQWLVDRAAEAVVAGRRPCALIVGAEALATRRAAKRQGIRLSWPEDGGFPDLWPPLEADMGVHPVERAHGLSPATAMYALIETALAHRRGRSPEHQRRAMGLLMARCAEVAAANPCSWFPQPRTADELTTVTADNRMICFPYPKYLNAVMDVDMAAAVVVGDAALAAELGLASDEVAHLLGWADTTEVWHLSARADPSRSPALVRAAAAALGAAGVGIDDVALLDLYACFPSSVEVALEALGVAEDDPRPPTLTGGLPAHGGPGNNYVTHALVNVLDALRSGRGETALVHGNGYYLTKHAVGVYGRRPPDRPPVPPDLVGAPAVDPGTLGTPAVGGPAGGTAGPGTLGGPGGGTGGGSGGRLAADRPVSGASRPWERERERERNVVPAPDGEETATVVAYTVPHGRDGSPQPGIVLLDLAGGRRTVALADERLTGALVAGDRVGSTVAVRPAPNRDDEPPVNRATA